MHPMLTYAIGATLSAALATGAFGPAPSTHSPDPAQGQAQTQSRPPTQQAPPDDARPRTTLNGCLARGRTPHTFVLAEARSGRGTVAEPPLRYVIVPETEDLFLEERVDNQVRVTGWVEPADSTDAADTSTSSTATTGRSRAEIPEQDLPKLHANAVFVVSEQCGVR